MSSPSLEVDAGLLAVCDPRPVDTSKLNQPGPVRDSYIAEIATDGVQQLLRALFELPVDQSDDGRVVVLPGVVALQLPREKPLPKKREPTTWEKFAQRKGIWSKKRDRLQYDQEHDDWRPRYGRHRVDDAEAQWCIPHKEGVTTGPDPWTDLKAAKKARVDKNGKQQERNLTGAKGARLPGTIDLGSATQRKVKGVAKDKKAHVAVAYDIAAASTASMGVFDKKVSGLEPAKDAAGAKAKLKAAAGAGGGNVRAEVRAEKTANLALLSRILGGDKAAPKVDKDKAANLHKARSERKLHRARK